MVDVLENSKEKKLTLFFGSLLLPRAPRQHSRGFSKWVRLIGSYQPYSDREAEGDGGGGGCREPHSPKPLSSTELQNASSCKFTWGNYEVVVMCKSTLTSPWQPSLTAICLSKFASYLLLGGFWNEDDGGKNLAKNS